MNCCLGVALFAALLVGCSPKSQGVVLIDPYLSGVLTDDEFARWQRDASSEGLRLDLVHLQLPDDGGTLFDQMRIALELRDDYQLVFVTPVLLREAELLAELSDEHLQGDIVVLGVDEGRLPTGLRGVAFDRNPAYRQLGELLAEEATSEGKDLIELILFFAIDTPETRAAANSLGVGVADRVKIEELWYNTVPDDERVRRDIEMWAEPNSVTVFAFGAAAPAALRISKERGLRSVFEGGGSEYEHVMYSVDLPFARLLGAAVRGETVVPAVIGSTSRSVTR
ncbi:MAG: hypothetical protein EA428_14355 [Spirochaetaceae bacterium]|nr:MAG: hypothetical protein EA428_14355 [Spirochaetaceae bacterium]